MPQKHDKTVAIGLGASTILLIVIGVISFASTSHLLTASKWVNHTHLVIERAERVYSNLLKMESSARGYMISKDRSHIDSYGNDVSSINEDILQLSDMVEDNAQQHAVFERINRLIDQKIKVTSEFIDLISNNKLAEATELVYSKKSKQVMDKIHAEIHVFEEGEMRLLAQRTEDERKSALIVKMAIGFSLVSVFILASVILSILNREIREKQKAQQDLTTQFNRIRDMYNHAPCGYHSLNENGIIIEINDTELKWLGYEKDEVVNILSFPDILEEKSRQTFYDNFPKFKKNGFLREKEFVLLAKNGESFPVLVSALGIHDENGNYVESRSIVFDISERKKAEKKIEELHNLQKLHFMQLEEANKELESFSYSVSHDLRAPLRHINGYIELLQKKCADELTEQGKRYLGIITQSSVTMNKLIDDLLLFSRMGRNEMLKTRIPLRQSVDEAIKECLANERKRDVVWEIDPLPDIEADPAMIKLVLVNLISNALKYSRPREHTIIHVGVESYEKENHFHVSDNGVGFDMEHVEKLFGVFQRLHSSSEFEGTGIGLANVQRIIKRHGGRVWAKGEVGKGATIYFSLPKT